jgi:hypothetical protein
MRAAFAIAFLAGGCGYLIALIGCLGSGADTTLGEACSAIGPLLRVPFLYVLPYIESRYLGLDSMVWVVVGNAIVWGAALAILVVNMRGRTKKPPVRA